MNIFMHLILLRKVVLNNLKKVANKVLVHKAAKDKLVDKVKEVVKVKVAHQIKKSTK